MASHTDYFRSKANKRDLYWVAARGPAKMSQRTEERDQDKELHASFEREY